MEAVLGSCIKKPYQEAVSGSRIWTLYKKAMSRNCIRKLYQEAVSESCVWKMYQEARIRNLYLETVCIWKLSPEAVYESIITNLCLKALSGIRKRIRNPYSKPVSRAVSWSCKDYLLLSTIFTIYLFTAAVCLCSTYSDIYFLNIFSAINLFNKIFWTQSCT